ncbi:HalOD1 output domain-containing protein [Halorubrum trueperi]|uniref:HalOD1 output domain-containing protein n=1 Tax=Halorubrum trueperi TaxID=2004704 RepID=A0ABD5UFB8_9EURY
MMNIQTHWDGDVPEYTVDLDGATDQLTSYLVISSIADLTDQNPDDLESLWDTVDPDALDSFVAHADRSSTPYQLTFQYQGYTVTVADRCLRFIPNEAVSSSASI